MVHGARFDGAVLYATWLALLGDWAYAIVLWLNTGFNRVRRRLGFGYWSLSAYLKGKVRNAVQFIADCEAAAAEEARRRGLDGVVCGQIHNTDLHPVHGVLYANDGDWVESCTGLGEHFDRQLEVIQWAKLRSWSMIERQSFVTAGSNTGETAIA